MKKSLRTATAALVALLAFACGKKSASNGGGPPPAGSLSVVKSAIRSLPLLDPSRSINGGQPGALVIAPPTELDPLFQSEITGHAGGPFKMECHDGMTPDQDTVNDCPAGVPVNIDNKFSAQTLMGQLFGVEQWVASGVYSVAGGELKDTTTCIPDGGSPAVDAGFLGELAAQSFTVVGASKYVLPMPNHYDCFKNVSDPGTQTPSRFNIYKKTSVEEAGRIYSLLTDAYKVQMSGEVDSQLWQMYARNGADGGLQLLGLHTAAFINKQPSGFGERVLIFVNPQKPHFVVKFNKWVVALGKGGFDPSTGTYQSGHFLVKVRVDDPFLADGGLPKYPDGGDDTNYKPEQLFCFSLDGATGAISVVDGTECSGDSELAPFFTRFFDTGSFWSKEGTGNAKEFLDLTDAEVDTTLAAWGALLQDATYMSDEPGGLPASGEDTDFPSALAP